MKAASTEITIRDSLATQGQVYSRETLGALEATGNQSLTILSQVPSAMLFTFFPTMIAGEYLVSFHSDSNQAARIRFTLKRLRQNKFIPRKIQANSTPKTGRLDQSGCSSKLRHGLTEIKDGSPSAKRQ
jgi:hypothetical protein